jgi:hypothetical protein
LPAAKDAMPIRISVLIVVFRLAFTTRCITCPSVHQGIIASA